VLLLVRKEQYYFFQFKVLNRCEGLWHAVTSRHGGESRPPYASLNLSHGVDDDPKAVTVNRKRLHGLTGGGVHFYSRQNHGTSIRVITRDALDDQEMIQTLPEAADALITDVPGIYLLIQTADCQAVMLFDPQRRVVANVHGGWRGSVADILGRTVKRMVDRFDCDPGDMLAAIGPSLGPCCAEFVNFKDEIPPYLWPFRVGEHHFDFWRISRHQLINAGLAPPHVHAAAICTRCNPHLFFSYRAQRQTGRFAALIGMRDDDALRN
jgi:YfiH family protein